MIVGLLTGAQLPALVLDAQLFDEVKCICEVGGIRFSDLACLRRRFEPVARADAKFARGK